MVPIFILKNCIHPYKTFIYFKAYTAGVKFPIFDSTLLNFKPLCLRPDLLYALNKIFPLIFSASSNTKKNKPYRYYYSLL